MPRASYKPFTAYEEALGFHATRRNAHFFCAIFFGGILFKCMLMANYSTVVETPQSIRNLESNPQYQAMLDQRVLLMEAISTRDSMKKAMTSRRQPPPA